MSHAESELNPTKKMLTSTQHNRKNLGDGAINDASPSARTSFPSATLAEGTTVLRTISGASGEWIIRHLRYSNWIFSRAFGAIACIS